MSGPLQSGVDGHGDLLEGGLLDLHPASVRQGAALEDLVPVDALLALDHQHRVARPLLVRRLHRASALSLPRRPSKLPRFKVHGRVQHRRSTASPEHDWPHVPPTVHDCATPRSLCGSYRSSHAPQVETACTKGDVSHKRLSTYLHPAVLRPQSTCNKRALTSWMTWPCWNISNDTKRRWCITPLGPASLQWQSSGSNHSTSSDNG